jgi:ABC-2 type transport system permease protein
MSSAARVRALARKDMEEVRHQPGLLLPAAGMIVGLAIPALLVMIVAPVITGEELADSDFVTAASLARVYFPSIAHLSPQGQAQAFLLQQFLMFSLMTPILGSMSLAAQGIIGEKQARALEPLLATPMTTGELLLAKILTPFALSMALLVATFLFYLAAMAALGEPGVWRTLFWPRTLVVFVVVGPLVSLTALAIAAMISSRVNDPRTAQQLGGFFVLPILALFIAQMAGQFLLGMPAILMTALALVVVNVVLLAIGVKVFDRETILMRWK